MGLALLAMTVNLDKAKIGLEKIRRSLDRTHNRRELPALDDSKHLDLALEPAPSCKGREQALMTYIDTDIASEAFKSECHLKHIIDKWH